MYIVHCNRPSKSARALAKALKGKKVNLLHGWSNPKDIVINWGDSGCIVKSVLNNPEAILLASNKRRAFERFRSTGVPIPCFATSPSDIQWKGLTVVRHKLQGHSGEGIELVEEGGKVPDAPLYVQYIKKEQEFRIHVGRSEGEAKILAVQRKARNLDIPDECVNWQIRNHDNGFVFVRQDADPNSNVLTTACDALRSIGLDFGAVDIIWNVKENKPYVLEINTAPGLEGQTIEDYATYFRNLNVS